MKYQMKDWVSGLVSGLIHFDEEKWTLWVRCVSTDDFTNHCSLEKPYAN